MSAIDKQAVLDFIEQNEADGEEGRRIKTAAQGGKVEPVYYKYESAPGESGRLREMARSVIFDVWNKEKRPARLREIFEGVRRRIAEDMDDGAWPKLWNPNVDKRTVDRRVNELSEDRPEFWPNYDFAPCLMVKPGFYCPNPMLFDDKVRQEIVKA